MKATEVMNPLRDLDRFTRAYIECALWSSTDDNEEPMDRHSWTDIAPECLQEMMDDCARFQAENAERIAADIELAGHDFWLTRNGHGAGFWDGDWEDGDELTEASQAYGECNLYIGDDGKIYC